MKLSIERNRPLIDIGETFNIFVEDKLAALLIIYNEKLRKELGKNAKLVLFRPEHKDIILKELPELLKQLA